MELVAIGGSQSPGSTCSTCSVRARTSLHVRVTERRQRAKLEGDAFASTMRVKTVSVAAATADPSAAAPPPSAPISQPVIPADAEVATLGRSRPST